MTIYKCILIGTDFAIHEFSEDMTVGCVESGQTHFRKFYLLGRSVDLHPTSPTTFLFRNFMSDIDLDSLK